MHHFLSITLASVGSGLGWMLGSYVGLFTAFVLSMVGMTAGWIAAIRIRKAYGW